jgi:hypothetical protein
MRRGRQMKEGYFLNVTAADRMIVETVSLLDGGIFFPHAFT